MPTDAEQKFIQAWRYATPELEEIHRRELLELDESAGLKMIGAAAQPERPPSGLIEFQAWMMRMRVIELEKKRSLPHHTSSEITND